MEKILNKIAALLNVKSLVTLIFTVVFAILAVTGVIVAADFMTAFLVIVTYYFSRQDGQGNSNSSS